jgi:nitronate monooxygenase
MAGDPALAGKLQQGLRLPVFVAPMFLISGTELVIAASRAGVAGAYPVNNARTIEDLDVALAELSAGCPGLWAITIIVHPSYSRFEAELDLVCRHKPRIVITALGSPRRPMERVHGYGGLVFSDVISAEQARKAVDAGVDGLILVASGAGGHTGRYSPFAFVDEVRRFWDGPIVLGGAIGTARAVLAALTLGADFAYMGTRFIAAPESQVTDANRDMLVRSGMGDVITTAAISGVPANWLRESLEANGFTPEMLKAELKIDFSNLHGDTKAWKSVWGAGQAVGSTRRVQTVAEIVDELAADYAALGAGDPRWPRP